MVLGEENGNVKILQTDGLTVDGTVRGTYGRRTTDGKKTHFGI